MRSRVVIAAMFAAAIALGGAASAHVTVNPSTATQGGFAKLTFRVPTEREVATTKLEVAFPVEQPLAFVSVKPHAGWSYQVTKAKLATPITVFGEQLTEAVSRITWTAASGNGIKPGEFDEFDVSVGPLPTVDSMVFKALQTYADGEVVRWIDLRTSGAADPEHPAPVLSLAAASPAPTGSASSSAGVSSGAGAGETDEDDAAEWVGWLGLGLGGLALLLAIAALVRSRTSDS